MNTPRARIKSGKASLIGGVVVGVAVLVLWVAITRDVGADSAGWLALGVVVSVGVGTWIRLADL